jgi:FAD/FMN-containing dehydrogenase
MSFPVTDLSGVVHRPGSAGYERERATFGGRVDQRPALVVAAQSPRDVRAALLLARRRRLPFAVQSTGHGTSVPADGAVLLKTGALRGILVDPDRRVARVGAGATNGELVAAAAPLGLTAVTGSHASVGVAGFTLGGGVGFLSRAYGFAADNLVAADVVTTAGEHLRVDADSHPDLLWALRGGGGGFAVVTALEVRLHPVRTVLAGTATFAPERARGVLAALRDGAATRPDALTATVVVGPEAVTVKAVHAGDEREGRAALAPLLAAGGTPERVAFDVMPVAAVDLGGTPPRHFELLEDLPIDAIVQAAQHARAVEVRPWGGAMARGAGRGPVGHRDVPWSVTIDGPELAAVRVRPYAHGGTFLNFAGDPARTAAAYTPADLAKLRALKRTWDPDALLGPAHTTPQAAGRTAAA